MNFEVTSRITELESQEETEFSDDTVELSYQPCLLSDFIYTRKK